MQWTWAWCYTHLALSTIEPDHLQLLYLNHECNDNGTVRAHLCQPGADVDDGECDGEARRVGGVVAGGGGVQVHRSSEETAERLAKIHQRVQRKQAARPQVRTRVLALHTWFRC